MPRHATTWQKDLAQWVADLGYGTLPDGVVAAASRSIVDVIGVALAGNRTDVGRLVTTRLNGRATEALCTAIGCKAAVGLLDAALINGTLCHALDFDDTSYALIGHTSAVVLPAALAAAEVTGPHAAGRDLLLAFVAGTEVACRVGRSLNPQLFDAGWFTTSTIGVLGAVAAAAKLWGLPPLQIEAGIAIACGQAGGIRANNGSMGKPIQCGIAARSGLEAADLARIGVSGAADVFEGHDGFLSVLGFDPNATKRPEWGNGTRFELVQPGLAIKRYPCCTAIGAAIEALLALRKEVAVEWRRVARVECQTTTLSQQSLPYIRPTAWREAQFSLHYCLAWALVFGALNLSAFTDEAVRDAEVNEAIDRVHVTYQLKDGSGRSEAAEVTVVLHDGRSYRTLVREAIGNPKRPLSDADISDKFRACCDAVGTPADADALLRALWRLPDHLVSDIARRLRAVATNARPEGKPAHWTKSA